MAVKLGTGFTTPPERLQPPAEFTAASEVEAPDVRQIVISMRQAGASWLLPPSPLDEQVYELQLPDPRHVELAPRLREERHWQGALFGRRRQ